MKHSTIFGLILFLGLSCSQKVEEIQETKLLVRGAENGKSVKLLWCSLTYGSTQEGVVVKKRTATDQDWETVSQVIEPGYLTSDLSTRTNDAKILEQSKAQNQARKKNTNRSIHMMRLT